MILLTYEMNSPATGYSRKVNGTNLHRILTRHFNNHWIKKLSTLEFSNAGRICLICGFSSYSRIKDRYVIDRWGQYSDECRQFIRGLTEMIEGHLMQYERQKFTFMEVEL